MNVDYDARYDRFMSNSDLTEGLSGKKIQKWYVSLKLSAERKNDLDDRRKIKINLPLKRRLVMIRVHPKLFALHPQVQKET